MCNVSFIYLSLHAILINCFVLKAGLPAGVLNIVNGFGPETGAALASHPLVGKVAFTGSTVVSALSNLACSTVGFVIHNS